ncbi:hypothetical protein ABRQ22_14750 [Cellulosimicrobium sp. ES-005]|uniref:Uncharacterized protein n=1 Tax=Cellulosimicrobium sp. ES-005 TaxID=3163031 RepID=A0AAU8FY32_9MICO
MTDTTTEAVAPEARTVPKLKPEVKAAWLEALRSGEYTQTRGVLERTVGEGPSLPVGFCCLGVLCKVAVDAGAAVREASSIRARYGVDGERFSLYGPVFEIAEWAFESPDGAVWEVPTPDAISERLGGSPTVSLAGLNDDFGYTFAQIADLIEQHL